MSDVEPMPRRSFLQAVAGFGLLAFAGGAQAAPASPRTGVYTPPGLERDLPPEAGRGPRARFDARAPFDLDDPRGFALARTKAMVNLVGATSYLSVLTRHMLVPDGRPSVPFVNELELFTMYLERTPQGDVQRSQFTRVHLDPATNRRVHEVRNPLTGAMVPLADTLFALTTPVRFEREAVIRQITETAQPWLRLGEWLDFVSLAIRNGEGPHQPQLDTSVWRVRHDELMDPRRDLVDAHYSFSALMRAGYAPWTGYERADRTQLLTAKAGVKVNSAAALPDSVREHIVARYPERA